MTTLDMNIEYKPYTALKRVVSYLVKYQLRHFVILLTYRNSPPGMIWYTRKAISALQDIAFDPKRVVDQISDIIVQQEIIAILSTYLVDRALIVTNIGLARYSVKMSNVYLVTFTYRSKEWYCTAAAIVNVPEFAAAESHTRSRAYRVPGQCRFCLRGPILATSFGQVEGTWVALVILTRYIRPAYWKLIHEVYPSHTYA